MLKSLKCVLASLILVSAAQAQVILYEPFDFGPGVQTLGNEGGWQADWNNPAPSVVPLTPRNTTAASPFHSSPGLAIQPSNSKMRSYLTLPEQLNGKTVFFSYTMKAFGHKNVSSLQFRSTDGTPIYAGFHGGLFKVQTNKGSDTNDLPLELKRAYFIVGQLEVSLDGRKVTVSAAPYTAPGDVPTLAPATITEWPVSVSYTYGKDKVFEGVGFLNASANGAFDELRIGYTWYDVTGRM